MRSYLGTYLAPRFTTRNGSMHFLVSRIDSAAQLGEDNTNRLWLGREDPPRQGGSDGRNRCITSGPGGAETHLSG